MLGIYLGLSVIAFAFWAIILEGVDEKQSIWLYKEDRDKLISIENLTKIGKFLVFILVWTWNLIILPWIVIYWVFKGIKKLILKDK